MLLQFNFKNYKSFKEEATLDLSATKETELSFHVRNIGSEKVLPVAVIYGANAAGKSNVQEALDYMQTLVLRSLNFGEESKEDKFIEPTPFVFDKESKDADSSFEVFFTVPEDDKKTVYQYGFSIGKEGVVEEWFNYKSRTSRSYSKIFFRSSDEIEFDGIPLKNRENLRIALTEKTLLVSLGAKLKVEKLRIVFAFFASMEFADFGKPIENFILSNQVPSHIDDDESVRKDILRYFSSFDESIVDLRVEVVKDDADTKHRTLTIDAGHKVIGSDEISYIPLKYESAGTLKMFALYPFVHEVLENGGLLFVDELNARLHPILVRCFVQMFLDPDMNPQNAQLIFTSHDSWQLNNGTFRRDEIWFTEKDKDGVSSLYSLADFISEEGKSIRSEENFEKNYLLGKYGGIPKMKKFIEDKENNDHVE